MSHVFPWAVAALLASARPALATSPEPEPEPEHAEHAGDFSAEHAGAYDHSARASGLDCAQDPCARVLPSAVRFERPEGKPYVQGFDAQGQPVGWVVLSSDVVDIKGYSGKPVSTVVGLDPAGVITGGRVVHHSEPILLIGIPEQALHDFVDSYAGVRADDNVVVGTAEDDEKSVDIISGATVTTLAENRTILDSARALGQDVGVLARTSQTPGHFVQGDAAWSWEELEKERAFGRLTVTGEQMGATGQGYEDAKDDSQPFIDLWFTIADAPQVGRAVLGDQAYARAMAALQPGEHLVVVLGNGSSTFKGSGFVRGGIFDRVRIEQGLSSVTFRDLDYTNLNGVEVQGAPTFKEGALFVARGGKLDPGRPFDFSFLGSRFDAKGGFSREFHAFKSTWRLPKSVYKLDGPDPEDLIWHQAWKNDRVQEGVLLVWLLALGSVFAARRWTTASMKRLGRLHLGFLLFAFAVGGLILRAQPSVTQILTFVGSVAHQWRWGLFLTEPLLFIFWIFLVVVTLVWGRGVFCGWACPYGAFNELLFKLGRLLHLPSYELPEAVHSKLRYLRYAILLGLVVAYLVDPITGEQAAEIEPFKSTFFVHFWTRQWYYAGWWVVLAGLSLVMYRPFCRYLCPLGAGLALPSSVRLSGPYRRDFCSKCKICTRGCEPRAIRANGTIDPRECLSCMECEANWRDDQVCPPLVKLRRDLEKAGTPRKVLPRESP